MSSSDTPEPLIVPVALRPDFTARVHIPTDLLQAEAEKIARVILAYGKPMAKIADEILVADINRGLSLRKTALKHGTTVSRVRGAVSREALASLHPVYEKGDK